MPKTQLTKPQVEEKLKGHQAYHRVLHEKQAATASKLQSNAAEIDWCEQMLKELDEEFHAQVDGADSGESETSAATALNASNDQ